MEETKLKDMVKQRFGETDKDKLEEHFTYMEWAEKESSNHKKQYFRRGKMMRWTALGCSVSSGILALKIFETTESGFFNFAKILLTLCSILGPIMIAFLEKSQDLEKNRETWIRHRIYVNNCINECLEYCNCVKKYNGINEGDARKLFLENMVQHREDNNKKFEENMK